MKLTKSNKNLKIKQEELNSKDKIIFGIQAICPAITGITAYVEPIFAPIALGASAITSLYCYELLSKNEESKENNFSKSYRTTKEMEKEKVENRVFSLFVNSLGAFAVGFSMPELLNGELFFLLPLGMGAIIMASSQLMYKNKSQAVFMSKKDAKEEIER